VTLDYPRLRGLITAGAARAVADALVAADEPTRRALATHLPGHRDEIARDWRRREVEGAGLLLAGAGCLPKAPDVVRWLRHSDFRWGWAWRDASPADLVRVLAAPGRPAMATVARQLAERLRTASVDAQWPIAGALLLASGVEPAPTDAVVRGWARQLGRNSRDPAALAAALRVDPWLPAMLPRLFEVDGLGGELHDRWQEALVEVCADGTVDRAGCWPAACGGCAPATAPAPCATSCGSIP